MKHLVFILVTLALAGCLDGNDDNSGAGLPPDPGEAGQQTLEGFDLNGNDVRDDVEISIFRRYPNPNEEVSRTALMQHAKAYQEYLLAGTSTDTDVLYEAAMSRLEGVSCIIERFNDPKAELDFLREIMLNTDERLEVSWMASSILGTQTFSAPASTCSETVR